MAKTAELKDRFNQFEASLWFTTSSPVYSGGVAILGSDDYLRTKVRHSLADSYLQIEVVEVSILQDDEYVIPLRILDDSAIRGYWFEITRISGVNKIDVYIDSTDSMVVGPTYDPDTHKFFRLESIGDMLYFKYSTDGKTWINAVDPIEDTDFNTDNAYVLIDCGTTDADSLMVDNFNIPVTPEVGESYPLPSFSVV